ncbi:hypothetical protein [Rhodoferax sp. TS-BS-61-7]|uniref:hypothetical protein n=1 Tax=Rhodoferax sp. TS-BS-61-7 TaxID=2094194 RepID=UPI0011B051BE|nr:hypothetical protein [Rhodoferax sp. TS-BS-61-7]
MSNHHIYLPDQSHYRLEEIAKSIEGFPPQVGIKKGIDCVGRKYLPKNFWLKKPDSSYRLKGLVGSVPLTDADRIELSRLLPQLPEITDNMSDTEIDKFFDEYYKSENRPNWEPDIKTPSDRYKAQRDYDERITKHCENFILKVHSGHFHLFDSDLNALRGASLHPYFAQKNALVSREDASKYLKQLELDFIISNSKKSRGKSERYWTTENVNEMREYRKNSTAKETAAYFGVSVTRMNQVFKDNPRPEEFNHDAPIQNKNKKPTTNIITSPFEIWNKQTNK